jgi:hypothetical protein
LAVIDLSKVKHLALDNPAIGRAFAFHDIPIAVFLAIFETTVTSQKHTGPIVTHNTTAEKGGGSTLQSNLGVFAQTQQIKALVSKHLHAYQPEKILTVRVELRKSG